MDPELKASLDRMEELMRYNSKELQTISKTTIIIQLLVSVKMILKAMK